MLPKNEKKAKLFFVKKFLALSRKQKVVISNFLIELILVFNFDFCQRMSNLEFFRPIPEVVKIFIKIHVLNIPQIKTLPKHWVIRMFRNNHNISIFRVIVIHNKLFSVSHGPFSFIRTGVFALPNIDSSLATRV